MANIKVWPSITQVIVIKRMPLIDVKVPAPCWVLNILLMFVYREKESTNLPAIP